MKRSRLRDGVFAAVVCVGVFAGINAGVEWLERRDAVQTLRPDDAVQHVEERLFERQDGRWTTTRYAERTMVRSSFAEEKGDTFRAFLLGGSFAMGSPYRMQALPDRGGGMDSFLRAGLRAAGPVDVVNVAAGAQNSYRVRSIAEEVVERDPDVLIVASCNNEGAPSPGYVRSWLQRQGSYRLLRLLLRPATEGAANERTWFTLQDEQTDRVRSHFRQNLEAIVAMGRERGVPVLLATLPVNLTYRGFDPGGRVVGPLMPGEDEEPPMPAATAASYPVPPMPADFSDLPPCQNGVLLFEAGHYDAALPLIRRCLEDAEEWPRLAPFLRSYVALAELELGLADQSPTVDPHLREAWGDCVADGILTLYADRPAAAAEQLRGCDDSPEAIRWLGLALRAQGEHERARTSLEQSVELAPRNRCRPSFNRIIREVAAADPATVTLVDLEAEARRLAPDGLPGHEQYIDYCHMNWRGYGGMAAEVLRALGRRFPDLPIEELDVEATGRALKLPPGDNREQLSVTSTRMNRAAGSPPGPE